MSLDDWLGTPKPKPKPKPEEAKPIEKPHNSYLPAGKFTPDKVIVVRDVNVAEPECKRYVEPGRTRCDDKDASGKACGFVALNCAIRDKRFRNQG